MKLGAMPQIPFGVLTVSEEAPLLRLHSSQTKREGIPTIEYIRAHKPEIIFDQAAWYGRYINAGPQMQSGYMRSVLYPIFNFRLHNTIPTHIRKHVTKVSIAFGGEVLEGDKSRYNLIQNLKEIYPQSYVVNLTYGLWSLTTQFSHAFADKDYIENQKQILEGLGSKAFRAFDEKSYYSGRQWHNHQTVALLAPDEEIFEQVRVLIDQSYENVIKRTE
jgi:hypothetical protein